MTSSELSEPLPPESLTALRDRGLEPVEIEPLPGDVSVRRYFRARFAAGTTSILAVYPPEIVSTCPRFAKTTALLTAAGVPVPEIEASLCEHGLMVLEDLGDRTLYDLRSREWSALEPLLRQAVDLIPKIAGLPAPAVRELNPPLDEELMRREIDFTWSLLFGENGALPGSPPTALLLVIDQVIEELAAAPQSVCHRDFMARNLVPLAESPGLAVLDHQDLRIGPREYDLASLLNDSLFPPERLEARLMERLLHSESTRLGYHRAACQRTLKAVGTFLSFSRRGDSRHEPLIPPTLERARAHLHHLPEATSHLVALDSLWADLRETFSAPRAPERSLLD